MPLLAIFWLKKGHFFGLLVNKSSRSSLNLKNKCIPVNWILFSQDDVGSIKKWKLWPLKAIFWFKSVNFKGFLGKNQIANPFKK